MNTTLPADRDWKAYLRERCSVDANGCLSWTLFAFPDGYGCTHVRRVTWRAHRLAWTVFRGPIPDDMTVDHLCFNTLCCNPEHLRLLPNLENARRQRSAFKTHCIRGHEFTPENTIRTGGNRRCRECARARYRRRAATKKEKA